MLFEDSSALSAERIRKVWRPSDRHGLRIELNPSIDCGIRFNSHTPWDRVVLAHKLVNDSQASPIKVSVTIQFRACSSELR